MSNTFIVYVSTRTDPDDKMMPRDIAIESSRNNQAKDISGILMGIGPHFLQVLEGDAGTLEELLGKIEQDPRHHDLQILYRGEMSERVFGRWSMGCVSATSSPTQHGSAHFEDISAELSRLADADSDESREALKDLLVQIPKRIAENELAVS